jgi:hypothetical protein
MFPCRSERVMRRSWRKNTDERWHGAVRSCYGRSRSSVFIFDLRRSSRNLTKVGECLWLYYFAKNTNYEAPYYAVRPSTFSSSLLCQVILPSGLSANSLILGCLFYNSVSNSGILSPEVRTSLNDELETIWKQLVVTLSRSCLCICLEKPRKTTKTEGNRQSTGDCNVS